MLGEDCSTAGIYGQSRDYFNSLDKKPKVRKQGSWGRVGQRLERLKLPSIILCNAQSIRDNVSELQANVIDLEKLRHACIIAFTGSGV